MSYAEFGRAFVHEAVTPDRIKAVIQSVTGGVVDVGPLNAGPGGVALATATGRVGEPVIETTGDEPLAYLVRLPLDCELEVAVAGTHHRFGVEAEVRVAFTVLLAPPLSLQITPEPPTYRDVDVKVHPHGMQAKVMARAGNVHRELRKEIARYVRHRISTDVAGFGVVELHPLMRDVADRMTGASTNGGGA
jgi:hypothetical protein